MELMSNWQQGGTTAAFSVEQALALLRQVPLGGLNDRMVIDVIRKTLESTGISIPSLLETAAFRESEMQNEIMRIQSEISALHQAIEEKNSQVQAYQAQLSELGTLRDRFEG
jgi:hypothetical protein